MWCAHCEKDGDHGSGNCPHRNPIEKNKISSVGTNKLVIPDTKEQVLISRELYDQLIGLVEKHLDPCPVCAARTESERLRKADYRKRKANG